MGKACTFFGHRDCPDSIKPELQRILADIIENHSVDKFYVGRQGKFDALVFAVLKELGQIYPHITYFIVLERVPVNETGDFSDTLLPDGIENVHPRYAIDRRNTWMLKNSQYVVTYVTHSWGGAAKFADKAKHMNKTILPIK